MLYPNVQPFEEDREYYYSHDTMVFSKSLSGQLAPQHPLFKMIDNARVTYFNENFGFVLFEDESSQMYCVMVMYTWCKIRIGTE